MDHFKFFETAYFNEIDRKQQIENNLTMPIGAIAAAFGVLGYYFTHFQFDATKPIFATALLTIFVLGSLGAFGLLCFSVYWCLRLAVSTTYEYLPGSETLQKYYDNLKNWHVIKNKRLGVKNADQEFQDYLISAMTFCGQHNWQRNNVRSEMLSKAKTFASYALVALALVAISYYVSFWYNPIQSK